MASSKAALKAIKTSIDAGDFTKAASQAEDLIREDKKNATALLFLGFAKEKLGDFEGAEKAIRDVLKLKPQDIQAYKGLITLYEKQGSTKVDQYHDVAASLAGIYAEQEDREQSQNVIDKYEMFAKKNGSQSQYRHALELILPTSPLYPILEGRVMQPSLAYLRILESAQNEEKEWINTQIGERRTRLGAKIDQVTREVKSEAIARFQVEEKYAALADWTRDDEVRHDLEQKLFQRMYDNLTVMSKELKSQQRDKVLNMANGMVIIKQPYLLAWKVALEWVDAEELSDWDVNIFHEYNNFFPEDGLSKVLRGFLDSDASPFPRPTEKDEEEDQVIVRLSEADQLIMMNEGLEANPESMLGQRIMAHTLLHLEEWQGAVDASRKAQRAYLHAQNSFCLDLQNSLDGVNVILGNSLITFQAPRHHPEALNLFQGILSRKPLLTPPLLGIGLIYEEDENWSEAVKFLAQAADRDPDNVRIRLELAWCKAQNGELEVGLSELQETLSQITAEKHPSSAMKAITLYRIGCCLWNIDTSAAARKDRSGPYKYFMEAIKLNQEYAPAYTMLGIYFQDYGKSKQRARTALQKAFEISTSELEAAQRLANQFAHKSEWDLVELVAQRVVASGKARPAPGSKKKAYSWPFSALGVVQMNKQQYSQAIVSFQAALRIAPEDYHSWVGLGESYHNAGRHVAATRAFAKAERIDHGLTPDKTWFAKYMLANVQREMGAFDEAIVAYQDVLSIKPGEFGILIALLQTTSESAWAKVALGMYGEAAKLAATAIETAGKIASDQSNVFNLWKAVGDACSVLGHVKHFASTDKLAEISFLLQAGVEEGSSVLCEVDKLSVELLDSTEEEDSASQTADRYLVAAILAHKRGITSAATDRHAQAVSWYNLGWAEHQAYASGGPLLNATGKKPQRFLKAAMKCFKRAIELEAGNSEFWNALGVVTMSLSPTVSQHSFVRSLHLNDHSARTWTNIGVLYLIHDDRELANDAFTRAQSEDPEYADAWVGQGLLAMLYNSISEARGLFMHAFEIADSSLLPPKRHYAVSAFDHLLKHPSRSQEITNILQPLFALRQFTVQKPDDVVAAHLMSLLAERVGDFTASCGALEKVCDAAETEYEKSESQEYLVRYAQAKADLARAYLGVGDFEAAAASAETALDLSAEASEFGASYTDLRRKWRLSAHVTAGLAHSHLKQVEPSIKMFQAAMEESSSEPDVVCILAQVLWAKGGADEKEAARSQLFDVIEQHPGHVQATNLLAVTGLLDDDEDVLEAVEEDLKSLRKSDQVSVSDKIKVSKVLAGILSCSSKSAAKGETDISDALSGIMLAPAQPQGWLELAQAVGEEDRAYPAEMAVMNAERQIPPAGDLLADDLAVAYAGTRRVADALKAKMLAPWMSVEIPASFELPVRS